MRSALLVTGIATAIVVLMPGIVVVGFLFLIIPGLILALVPTVFLYLASTALIRRFIGSGRGVLPTVVALGISLAIGWAVVQPFRAKALSDWQAAQRPDVAPDAPIALSGRVRVETIGSRYRKDSAIACDYLCAAILELPGVRSVSVVRDETGVTFALRDPGAQSGPGAFPDDPGQLYQKLGYPGNYDARKRAGRALEARWALRLATNYRLSAEPLVDGADWTLRSFYEGQRRGLRVWRAEIVDANSTARYRASVVRHRVLERIFHFGFEGGSSADGFAGAGFNIGRQSVRSGDARLESDTQGALLNAIQLPPPIVGADTVERLKEEVRAMLADPAATPGRIALATRWLSLFWFDAAPDDHALIAKVVADPRVRDVRESIKHVFKSGEVPMALRDAYATRILMEHTPGNDRAYFARELAEFPAGAFADPEPVHRAVWENREIREDAAPFLERLADQGGPDAALALLRALDETLELDHWYQRRTAMAAIRAGFIRLGPAGSAAAPRIRELFLRRPSPIMNNANEAQEWRLALARIGVPISELPFFANQSATMIADMQQRVADRLRRYDEKHQQP